MHDAIYFEKLEGDRVRCTLCPHGCIISEGKRGICRGRKNVGGILKATNYAETVSIALDPIEKKPLYHFYPGRDILSIGANGCNFACNFCQNWEIAQADVPTRHLSPEEAVSLALKNNSIGIAYTYTEPLIWYEYLLDTAKIVRSKGLKNVLVSNGYINEAPLRELLPLIDAMNIDVKSMDEAFYKKECKGSLAPVLRSVELASKETHVEVTNLIIPGLNDSDDNFKRLADWLSSISPDIPLHFSAYRPCYKCTAPPTPDSTLLRARGIASKKLNYVYLGNSRLKEGSDTICPNCGKAVIKRSGFSVSRNDIVGGRCSFCQESIPIVGV